MTALALMLIGGQAEAQVDGIVRQKSQDADRIAGRIVQEGQVRVIVEISAPIPDGSYRQGQTGLDTIERIVHFAQGRVLATHVGADTAKAARWSVRQISHFPMMAMSVDATELSALAADARVLRIWEDISQPPFLTESVPLIGMNVAYTNNATGDGMIVAILDTGVQSSHPFLTGKVTQEACFSTNSATSTSVCPNGQSSQTGAGAGANCSATITGCDHGTHVAGIAAGSNTLPGNPPNGVAKGAKVFAVQVFSQFTGADCSNFGLPSPCALTFLSDQIAGLSHVLSRVGAIPETIASANMSLGGGSNAGTCDGDSRKAVIDQLKSANVATVIASGNSGFTNAIGAPGCISTAVTVGSTTKSDVLSSFSNSSAVVDLLAPGSSIASSVPGGGFASFNGTSMATPHVAGAFAAIRSRLPSATIDQIENALKSTGTPITDTRPGGTQTRPRIRVDLALNQLLGGQPPAGACADAFASATPLKGTTGSISGSNAAASGESGEPDHAGVSAPLNSVWCKFTAAATGTATLTAAGSTFDTTLAAYTGSAVNALTLIAANDDFGGLTSQISFTVTTGTTYFVAVDGFSSATGNYVLNFMLPSGGGTACADAFASATLLAGTSGSVSGSTVAATRESGEPRHYTSTTGDNSVWCKWVAPATGQATFNTDGSAFDTVVAVYTGSSLTSLTQIMSDDDHGAGLNSQVSFHAVGGVTYYIAVDGFSPSASGDFTLAWSLNTNQGASGLFSAVLPYARSVRVGTPATAFGVLVNGTGSAATDCYLQMPAGAGPPGTFVYQTANAANQLTGSVNSPVSVAAGAQQNFVFGFTPSATFSSNEIQIGFDCADKQPATSTNGVNTFILSASNSPTPDLVAIGDTLTHDGIVHIPGTTGTGLLVTAAINIGAGGTITTSADDGGRGLPLSLSICQTNAAGVCMAAPSPSVTSSVAANQTVTYSIFVLGAGTVAFDPAVNRLFMRLRDGGGVTRGATNVAVCTSLSCPGGASALDRRAALP